MARFGKVCYDCGLRETRLDSGARLASYPTELVLEVMTCSWECCSGYDVLQTGYPIYRAKALPGVFTEVFTIFEDGNEID